MSCAQHPRAIAERRKAWELSSALSASLKTWSAMPSPAYSAAASSRRKCRRRCAGKPPTESGQRARGGYWLPTSSLFCSAPQITRKRPTTAISTQTRSPNSCANIFAIRGGKRMVRLLSDSNNHRTCTPASFVRAVWSIPIASGTVRTAP
ncbi:Uncharacterised protein [Mycobacteroides abscessus subsp. massiliense]|nr:Uncharacterised protein [Mycobacteroides abscessus subsp. massiliense]